MSDKQNPNSDFDELLPADDAQSYPDKSKSESKSYYYDDSTGYEIYKEESDDDDQNESGCAETR